MVSVACGKLDSFYIGTIFDYPTDESVQLSHRWICAMEDFWPIRKISCFSY